ncbi:hypothetical protein BKA63DRAFT_608820 [Paraphoma chrysanthemicola]|nr:hypothetical protein BKA63DRAFT_608820 [Paraphoma chrysanthemicola]
MREGEAKTPLWRRWWRIVNDKLGRRKKKQSAQTTHHCEDAATTERSDLECTASAATEPLSNTQPVLALNTASEVTYAKSKESVVADPPERSSETSFVDVSPQQSLWGIAFQRLEERDRQVYIKMFTIHQDEVLGLKAEAKNKGMEVKGLSPEAQSIIRTLLDIKDFSIILTALEPTKAAFVVFRGIFGIFQICVNDADALRGLVDNLVVVATRFRYWTSMESMYSLSSLDKTTKSKAKLYETLATDVENLYAAILEFQVTASKECQHGRTRRIFEASATKERLSALVKTVDTHHDRCEKELTRCKVIDEKSSSMKEWISETDYETIHESICEKTNLTKYPDCAKWLLSRDQYAKWWSEESGILWIKGTVGTGKTTLMARIIQNHLDKPFSDPKHRIAYFYCSRVESSGYSSYKNVLRSLLRQAAYDSSTGTIAHEIHELRHARDKRPFPQAIGECEKLLVKLLRNGIHLRIMIDALDECDEASELLCALKKIHEQEPARVQLLFSSRAEVHVKKFFPDGVEVNVSAAGTEEQMRTFVTQKVQQSRGVKILDGKRRDLEEKLIELICEKANGMFRWAELQINFFLNPKKGPKSALTVEEYLGKLRTRTLAGMDELNATYKEIFESNSKEGTHDRSLATFIYQTLLSGSPTSLVYLVRALKWVNESTPRSTGQAADDVTPDLVLNLTRNFVLQKRFRGELEFAHSSAIEFLQECPEYNVSACHVELAIAYITFQKNSGRPIDETWAIHGSCHPKVIYDGWRGHTSTEDKRSHLISRHRGDCDSCVRHFWIEYHCRYLKKEERQENNVSKVLMDFLVDGHAAGLYFAVVRDLVEVVEMLLDPDSNYDAYRATGFNWRKVIHWAWRHGDLEIFLLLKQNWTDLHPDGDFTKILDESCVENCWDKHGLIVR